MCRFYNLHTIGRIIINIRIIVTPMVIYRHIPLKNAYVYDMHKMQPTTHTMSSIFYDSPFYTERNRL